MSFPAEKVNPETLLRFDKRVESTLLPIDRKLAARFQEYLTSDQYLNLPGLMTSIFRGIPARAAGHLTWEMVLRSSYASAHKNELLRIEASKNMNARVSLDGLRYRPSCRLCSSGFRVGRHLGKAQSLRELLSRLQVDDAPSNSVPRPITDATIDIAYRLDQMRGDGGFDDEIKLIEKAMSRLRVPAPFYNIEVVSRLSKNGVIVAVHPTADIRIEGYASTKGVFSSQSEVARAEDRDPRDWMGIRYRLPCRKCLGTGMGPS